MKLYQAITFMLFVAFSFGLGLFIGMLNERDTIKRELHKAQYAPSPIVIGDSTYIIRYYSDFTCKNY